MKNLYRTVIITVISLLAASTTLFAGNRDRSGQAGAQHLLIDPWARTNGWGNAGVAEIRGIEALYSNVAGLAFIKKTDLAFSRTQYLAGSGAGIGINAIGIAQGLGSKKDPSKRFGTIALSIFQMGFGDINNRDICSVHRKISRSGTHMFFKCFDRSAGIYYGSFGYGINYI